MIGEIIAVGTELTSGRTLNTNARYLAGKLREQGIEVYYQTVVDDHKVHLRKALAAATGRSQVIILTGGLGPTKDDITKEVVCSAVGAELVLHEESLQRMKAYFSHIGREMAENNFKQVMLPKDAVVFPNDYGTAPGFALVAARQCIILLPGPPREMTPMFEKYVTPFLKRFADGVIVSHEINIFGMGESAVAALIEDFPESGNPYTALYAKEGEVALRITAKAPTEKEARELCKPYLVQAVERLGDAVYGIDRTSLEEVVVSLLQKHGLTVATAESCTAGLLSKRITDIPGASGVFTLGVTAYDNQIKTAMLDVPAEIIETYGAVSPEVAKGMAVGVRKKSGADLGVAITGIAGPDGGTDEKPVGLVYIAMCDDSHLWAKRLMLGRGGHERDYIRHLSASSALNLLRLYLELYPEYPAGGVSLEEASRDLGSAHSVRMPLAAETAAEIAEEPAVGEDVPSTGEIRETFAGFDADAEDAGFAAVSDGFQVDAGEGEEGSRPEDSAFAPENASFQTEEVQFDDNFILTSAPEDEAYDYEGEEEYEEYEEYDEFENAPWYLRVAMYLLPWRGDPVREIIRKCVFLVAMIGLIVSSSIVIPYFFDTYEQTRVQGEQKELLGASYTLPAGVTLPDGMNPKFAALWLKNPHTVGWIKIPNTKTDNVVVQCEDNEYYLDHNFYGKKNDYGEIFADYRNKISLEGNSQNIILYGHHMNNGAMMGQLKKYRQLSFYKENPTFQFDTIYQEGTWKIISVFITNTLPEHDNGQVFPYRPVNFATQKDFLDFITQVRRRSLYISPVDVQEYDEIVTLSTCVYDFKEARLVIVARRVRDGESPEVNVSEIKINPKILYPQVLHDKYRSTKPVFSDSESQSYSSRPTSPSYPGISSGSSSSSTSSRPASSTGTSSATSSIAGTSSKPSSSGSSSAAPSAGSSSAASSSAQSSSSSSSSQAPSSSEESSSEPSSSEPSSSESSSSSEPGESSQPEESQPEEAE